MTDPAEAPIDWFSKAMLEKLSRKKNVVKSHWLEMSFRELYGRLVSESRELDREIRRAPDKSCLCIIDEACDVANFAMFIAHKAREEYNAAKSKQFNRERHDK